MQDMEANHRALTKTSLRILAKVVTRSALDLNGRRGGS